ncbi:MAG TPA: pilus assembly protein PilM [Sedimentisphaerales bacterium]|nr:pilus assembly protein PilM [Sedimentisphaerales bacterium]
MISWRFKTRGQRPIGLDIGHNSLKMIQLAVNRGHISVLAASKVRIDPHLNGDPEERRRFVVSAIKKILREGKFRGRDVVSCLPNGSLKITSLRLAEAKSEEIEQALRKEVAQRFGLDPDEDAIHYVLAGDVRQGDEVKNELIVFAADNESIKSHIAVLAEAGLRLAGIDSVPCALFRSYERLLQRQEDKERTAVFVDIGSRFTTVVFGRGPKITFVKQIPIGGQDFNEEIATRLDIDAREAEMLRSKLRMERAKNEERGLWVCCPDVTGRQDSRNADTTEVCLETVDASTRQVVDDAVSAVAERLAREISLCFKYYTVTFRGKQVERAVLSGGEAYERILLNVLGQHLGVRIEVAEPLKGFDMTDSDFDSDRRGLLCEWAVAVGLSLKGWNGDLEGSEGLLAGCGSKGKADGYE